MIRSKYKPLNYLNRYLKKQHAIGLENLLFYGDIIAMKNSIENRSPFMDHRLVEFSFSKSHELKVNKSINKYVLRKNKGYLKFKNLLIELVENNQSKTFYKFGDGDYWFLKKVPSGSATRIYYENFYYLTLLKDY